MKKENIVKKLWRSITGADSRAASKDAERRKDEAEKTIMEVVSKRKKTATVTVGACVLLTAGGCAHVQGWLANGPSITLSAGVGPATVSLALNPGKTVVDVATTVTDTVASVLPTSGEVEAVPLPAPVAPATETR